MFPFPLLPAGLRHADSLHHAGVGPFLPGRAAAASAPAVRALDPSGPFAARPLHARMALR